MYIQYVCMYVCMYVWMHAYVQVYVCMYVCMYGCMYMYRCMYVCMYVPYKKIMEGENFGKFGKFYPIHQNFLVQLKKIDFEKLSCREYSPTYYLPIIADSLFAKIFSLQNFVSHSMYVCMYVHTYHNSEKVCQQNILSMIYIN